MGSIKWDDGGIAARCPTFLTRRRLADLDKILDELEKRAKESANAFVRDRVHEALRYRDAHDADAHTRVAREIRERYGYRLDVERSVELKLSDGRVWKGRSFTEAINDPTMESSRPVDVAIHCRGHGSTCRIYTLHDRIAASCDDLSTAVSLRYWMDELEEPWLLRMWKTVGSLPIWILWFLTTWFSLAAFANSPKETARKQAQQLLDKGLAPEDHGQALELLLAMASNHSPTTHATIPNWFWWLLGVGLIVNCVLLFSPPNFLFEIGGGARSMRRWRTWIQALKWLFSTVLVSGLLLPLLRVMLW